MVPLAAGANCPAVFRLIDHDSLSSTCSQQNVLRAPRHAQLFRIVAVLTCMMKSYRNRWADWSRLPSDITSTVNVVSV